MPGKGLTNTLFVSFTARIVIDNDERILLGGTVTTGHNLRRGGGGKFESRRRDTFRGVRANWPRQIFKTGTLEMRFPAIWSSTLQDLSLFSTWRLYSRDAKRKQEPGHVIG